MGGLQGVPDASLSVVRLRGSPLNRCQEEPGGVFCRGKVSFRIAWSRGIKLAPTGSCPTRL